MLQILIRINQQKKSEFDDVIILLRMKNCQYPSNKLKCEAEIWYVEAAYDADIDCGVEL